MGKVGVMPGFFNEHVRGYSDMPETLYLHETGQSETMYAFRNGCNACPNISKELKDRLKRLVLIGRINTGADSCSGLLWIDTENGKITAQDGGDGIYFALDVCNSLDDVIELWKRYVELCEKPEFVVAGPAFVDMLVWDRTRDYRGHAIEADALWREARTGLRNVGDDHEPQYMIGCLCNGCMWKTCSGEEQEGGRMS